MRPRKEKGGRPKSGGRAAPGFPAKCSRRPASQAFPWREGPRPPRARPASVHTHSHAHTHTHGHPHTLPSQACGPAAASRSGKQSWDCEVGAAAAAAAWGRGRRGLWRPFLAAGRLRAPNSAAAEDQTLAVARAGGGGSALGGASRPRPVRGHRRAGARGEGSLQASPLSLPAPRRLSP